MERLRSGTEFFLSQNLGYSFGAVALMGSALGDRMSILTIASACTVQHLDSRGPVVTWYRLNFSALCIGLLPDQPVTVHSIIGHPYSARLADLSEAPSARPTLSLPLSR